MVSAINGFLHGQCPTVGGDGSCATEVSQCPFGQVVNCHARQGELKAHLRWTPKLLQPRSADSEASSSPCIDRRNRDFYALSQGWPVSRPASHWTRDSEFADLLLDKEFSARRAVRTRLRHPPDFGLVVAALFSTANRWRVTYLPRVLTTALRSFSAPIA